MFSITGVYLSQRQQWPPRRRVLQRIHPPFVTVSQPPRQAFFPPGGILWRDPRLKIIY